MSLETQLSLARAWALLVGLMFDLRRQAAGPVCLTPARRRGLCALLRQAEGLARRWLVLTARAEGGPARGRPRRRQVTSAARPQRRDRRGPAAAPQLRLCEAEPACRFDPLLETPQPIFTFYPPGMPYPGQRTGSAPWLTFPVLDCVPVSGPVSGPVSAAGVQRRTQALADLIKRPGHHSARMARWLARAADKARTAPGRWHPLRTGRPPGRGAAGGTAPCRPRSGGSTGSPVTPWRRASTRPGLDRGCFPGPPCASRHGTLGKRASARYL